MKKAKVAYYPETNSLVIDLKGKPAKDADEVAQNIILSYDEDGMVTAIDIEGGARELFAPLLRNLALSRRA